MRRTVRISLGLALALGAALPASAVLAQTTAAP